MDRRDIRLLADNVSDYFTLALKCAREGKWEAARFLCRVAKVNFRDLLWVLATGKPYGEA